MGLRDWLNSLINGAAEEYGEFEDAVHNPLYPITHYTAIVTPGELMRGSWPTREALALLKADGFRAVVNLCSERQDDGSVIAAGMLPINLGFRDNTIPPAPLVTTFLSTVAWTPTFVHCEQGKGRTGCMVAAYRVMLQNWSPQDALDEAWSYGLGLPAHEKFIKSLQPR